MIVARLQEDEATTVVSAAAASVGYWASDWGC